MEGKGISASSLERMGNFGLDKTVNPRAPFGIAVSSLGSRLNRSSAIHELFTWTIQGTITRNVIFLNKHQVTLTQKVLFLVLFPLWENFRTAKGDSENNNMPGMNKTEHYIGWKCINAAHWRKLINTINTEEENEATISLITIIFKWQWNYYDYQSVEYGATKVWWSGFTCNDQLVWL